MGKEVEECEEGGKGVEAGKVGWVVAGKVERGWRGGRLEGLHGDVEVTASAGDLDPAFGRAPYVAQGQGWGVGE